MLLPSEQFLFRLAKAALAIGSDFAIINSFAATPQARIRSRLPARLGDRRQLWDALTALGPESTVKRSVRRWISL